MLRFFATHSSASRQFIRKGFRAALGNLKGTSLPGVVFLVTRSLAAKQCIGSCYVLPRYLNSTWPAGTQHVQISLLVISELQRLDLLPLLTQVEFQVFAPRIFCVFPVSMFKKAFKWERVSGLRAAHFLCFPFSIFEKTSKWENE